MAAFDQQFSALLASLYAGIDAERPWSAFLKALSAWMAARYSVLIIAAPDAATPGTFVAPDADATRSADYVESFFADDPFRSLPDGLVTSFRDFIDQAPAKEYRAYRDYLALAGGEQVLGVDLRLTGGVEARFRVMRTADRPDFAKSDRERMQALVPHLRIAAALFEKLQFAGAQRSIFQSATERLGFGVVVLDREQQIVSTNALAEQFLADKEGLRRRGGRIVFDAPAAARAIADALAPVGAGDCAYRFIIARPTLGDLTATLRPIDLPAIHSGTGALALFLSRPGAEQAIDAAALIAIFGLTTAEARLAATLPGARTLGEAAARLGVSANTAKTQLSAVFQKTGTHRQAELVAKLRAMAS